jgi:hypothetical protein
VEELFEMVAVGDAVELYAERTAELDEIFGEAGVAGVAGVADAAGAAAVAAAVAAADR